CATARLTPEAGICTATFSARLALRMRVSMSAIGSVCMCALPARLDHARRFAAHHDLAQLAARQPELAVIAARAPGQPAAVAHADGARIARQLLQLDHGRLAQLV